MPDLVDALNPQQQQAVTHRGGPCLVLAGAGSGKTRVITHRVAWLLRRHSTQSQSICAVTFTNKAAAEMRMRVEALLPQVPAHLWVLTFHALALRILRLAAGCPGAPPAGFSVSDRADSLSVWRQCQAALDIDAVEFPPGQLYEACSRAVNRLEDPGAWDVDGRAPAERVSARIWQAYRSAMERRRSLDFDSLLVGALRVLSAPTGRPAGMPRFCHLLVDEYQDTNRLQYRLLRALVADECSLMVVGDEDQSIYRWRGADIANVLQFQRDFEGATVIRLEQNYRSTQPILSAAGSLVAHNSERLGKRLWTDNPDTALPEFTVCGSERDEAVWVSRKIASILAAGDAPRDVAVLYRTNAQSRSFEEELAGRRVPFRVLGGPTFFRRAEIKDLLAYLRLAVFDDPAALERAAATPRRGVGPAALARLAAGSDGAVARLLHAASTPDPAASLHELGCRGKAIAGLARLGALLLQLRRQIGECSIGDLLDFVLHRSGYADHLRARADGEERRANVEELQSSAAEFGADEPARPATLMAFLDRAALVADADSAAGTEGGVSLMTIHAAKGLEFDNVFVTGLEDGLFPHASAVQSGQVEEERRLAYVAMTRARRRLFLSAARTRRVRGQARVQSESRFVREIDPRFLRRLPSVAADSAVRAVRDRPRSARGAERGPTAKPVRPDAKGTGTPAPTTALRPGAAVFHPMFGPGRIRAAQGAADSLKLTVEFPRAGTKQLLARFARLELLVEP